MSEEGYLNRRISRRTFLKGAAAAGLAATGEITLPHLVLGQAAGPLGFGAIDSLLGHSVVYEEYKGNLAEARRVAEEILRSERQRNDPIHLADALLARGVVHILQGEPVAALACFSELEAVVPKDPARRLRALTYAKAATYLRFNMFPNGSGAESPEIEDRWDIVAYLNEYDKKTTDLIKPGADIRVQLESRFIGNVLGTVTTLRAILGSTKLEESQKGTVGWGLNFRQQMGSAGGQPRWLAYLDLVNADLLRRARQLDAAADQLDRAKRLYTESDDLAGAATCVMTAGDWAAAPFSSPAVGNMAITGASGADSNPHWIIEERELDRSRVDADRARRQYEEAQRLYRQADAPRGLAALELREGYLATLKGDYRSAKRSAEMARGGFERAGDRLGYWSASIHWVLSRIGAGEFPEDRETAAQIGRWGAQEGSFSYALGLGLMLGRAGRHWLLRAGDYERALACNRLAEALHEALGATTHRAQSVADQGLVLKSLGEQAQAITLLERAADIYRADRATRPRLAIDMRHRVVFLLNDLYLIYMDRNDPDGLERIAARLQEEITQLAVGAPGTPKAALSEPKGELPQEVSDEGSLQDAEAFTTAMSSMVIQYAQGQIEVSGVIVASLRTKEAREHGDVAEAQRWLQVALAAARAARSGQRDFYEASAFAYAKDYDSAKGAYQRYLQKGGANAGLSGELAAFLSRFGEELRLQVRRTHAQAAGFFTRIKAYAEAQAHLEALESLAGKEWWKSGERPWESLSEYGEVHEGLGELRQAGAYYDQAITALESRRQKLSRDQLKTALAGGLGPQWLYFVAARTAVKAAAAADSAGDHSQANALTEQAYNYAERGKARGLLDLMASGAVMGTLGESAGQSMRAWHQLNAKLATWQGLLAAEQSRQAPSAERIAYLSGQIDAEEGELRRTESVLAASDPGFYQAINPQAQFLDIKRVESMLPAGTALLQYYFLGDDLLVWGISQKGGVRAHHTAIDTKRLARDIQAFHGRCERREAIGELGEELAQVLLGPMAEMIQANSHLIVVPYGAAHVLPFHALPWEGQPLVASHTFSYLPSASALQFVRRGQALSLPERILAVGNPAGMMYTPAFDAKPEPQASLPAAAAEATHVAGLFPKGRALIGVDATEAAVREAIGELSILHFATHGVLSEDAPLLSSILLANGDALTVYELMGLRLNADLVVLSACRTAQGKTTGGDDVLGLTRGLLAAGAKAALVSLWPVDDLATSIFMEEFYGRLKEGQSPEVALQMAQNHLRSLNAEQVKSERGRISRSTRGVALSVDSGGWTDYSHPFFWAPFILVG